METIAIPDNQTSDENSFDHLLSDLLRGGESLLQKHLTKDAYTSLVELKTNIFESTLLDCIKCYSRCDVGLTHIGIFATDSECYDKFSAIFHPVICDLNGIAELERHPDSEWGDSTTFGFLDPNASAIEWMKLSSRRSLEGHLYPPRMNEVNFEEVPAKVCSILLFYGV